MLKLNALLVLSFVFGWMHVCAMPNKNQVANADENGFARFTKLDFPLDANDSLCIFYLEFSTDPTLEPGIFGPFWHMPALSSKVERTDSNALSWYAPNGVTYFFCSHLAEKKGRQIEAFIDNTSSWRAIRKKNGYVIESLISGATFAYENGRLAEFMLRDKRRYVLTYRNDNKNISSVKDRSGASAINFEYHRDGRHVRSIKTFKGAYTFEYHARKAGDLLGTGNLYANALLLGKIVRPEAISTDEIEYSQSPSRRRGILLKNLTEIVTSPLNVLKMSMKSSGEEKGWIEWCSATGLVMADNGGEYMIGNDRFDSFFPNFKPGQGNSKFSAVKYTSNNMPNPAIYLLDHDNYYEIVGDPASGEILRKSKIGACGPSKMMTRKVEKLEGSLADPIWSLVKVNSFDDKGNLIREIDASGNAKEWVYTGDFMNGTIEELFNGEKISAVELKNGQKLYEMRKIGDDIYETVTDEPASEILFRKNGENIKKYKY